MANETHIITSGSPKPFRPEDITVDDLRHLSKDSFALWCLTSGAKPDNNEFDFSLHRYLLPLYMDQSPEVVVTKAAQLGLSVLMWLRIMWWLSFHNGRKGAIYVPTQELAQSLSKDRLGPLIDSCPDIKAVSGNDDKLGLRKIRDSSLYVFHIGGTASKDSVPLDYLSFDEVRLMQTKDIDQVHHRVSHSPYKMKFYASTTGMPNDNIDLYYQRGKQYSWVCKCNCPDGCNLPKTFPECVVYDDPRRPGQLYYRCPKCKWEIKDVQNGRYLPLNPSADVNSYQVSQLASKYRTLKDVWREYKETTNITEFYNSTLGLPYIDSANQGVSKDQLMECINHDSRWAKDEKSKEITAMGIDQGAGYCMVVIADLNKDRTRKRIRHVEIIEDTNPHYMVGDKRVSPYVRCSELISQFNVRICITDGMPNFNDALAFAQKHPGKVFIGYYSEGQKETVKWLDKAVTRENIRKAGPFLKFKYTASIGRFPALSIALGEWASGNVEIPPLDGLRQFCRNEKTQLIEPESPARRLFEHLPRLVKKWHVTNEETGAGKWSWIYVGGDPHLAHAWSYANIALERLKKQPVFTFA